MRTLVAVAVGAVALVTATPVLIVPRGPPRGAVLDIASDRACTGVLGIALVAAYPWTAPAAAIFLTQSAVVVVTVVTHSALAGSIAAGVVLVAKTGFLVRALRLRPSPQRSDVGVGRAG